MLEWIGFVASVVIAISMTMSSIVKFRLINLVGAATFSVYGVLIGSLPVAMLNGFIVIVDIYYLVNIFSKKEVFEYLQVRNDNRYLLRFLEFHAADIQRFFPGFSHSPEKTTLSFFILRDMAVAGLFLAHKDEKDQNLLWVDLDYVVPEYRDFKNGKYVYFRLRHEFLEAGYNRVITHAKTNSHRKYLGKLGFSPRPDGLYEINMKTPAE